MPPSGQPFSLLGLHNTTAISSTFQALRSRFVKLYKRKAHLHHYTSVDGFELDQFAQAEKSLTELLKDYKSVQQNITNTVPRLTIAG